MIFKVKQRGLLEKYDEEIDGEEKKSFVLGKNVTFSCMCGDINNRENVGNQVDWLRK